MPLCCRELQCVIFGFTKKIPERGIRTLFEVYPAPFAAKWRENKIIVEPDISVICDHDKLTDKGCSVASDWIVEIVSSGNSSQDYIRTLNLYADAGVRKYWIVNSINETVLVCQLEETTFGVSSYIFRDKVKVNIYDNLWIDFMDVGI